MFFFSCDLIVHSFQQTLFQDIAISKNGRKFPLRADEWKPNIPSDS